MLRLADGTYPGGVELPARYWQEGFANRRSHQAREDVAAGARRTDGQVTKIANIEVALRLFECGPGWKIVSFENPARAEMTFRLVHADGYAEEMAIAHAELHDNAVGVMQMVREWIKQRTFAGIAEQKPVVQVAVPAVIPRPTVMEPLPLPAPKPQPVQPQREVRTRLITLEE